MEEPPLLQRYRRDRRKLFEFLLSSGCIKQLQTPSGPAAALSAADFDCFSADYVIECLKYGGGLVDVSEARKRYQNESAFPAMVHSESGNSYFVVTDPDSAGSPPRRAPPPIYMDRTAENASCSSRQQDPSIVTNAPTYKESTSMVDVESLEIGLPSLKTGLSDDDLRDAAYEVLLASMFVAGVEINAIPDRKREKNFKFLSRLKSKKDNIHIQHSHSLGRHSELIRTIRTQMQISEAMDACIRQGLAQLAASSRMNGRIDVPQLSLGLLIGIYKSDFFSEKAYKQWKSRQANILEELLCFSADTVTTEEVAVRSSLSKILDVKEWDFISSSRREEVVSAIRQIATKLSSLPGQFGIKNETYYWTAGYHLNVRLYQKLLFGLFDVLDEGQLISEADEVLLLITLTWSTLGITQKMHNAIFGWVLFEQFVETDQATLLEHAFLELQKVLFDENEHGMEEQYMKILVCSRKSKGSEIKLRLVQAIFFSISIWCDGRLQDYHLHFSQKPSNFKRVLNLLSAVGVLISDESGEIKLTKLNILDDHATKKFKLYVEKSVEAACRRVADTMDLESKLAKTHPLALLANELRSIAKREFDLFRPVLGQWCPESGMITAKLLHQFYGERLKPFMDGVSCLSEDVRSVFPAAYLLDHELTQLHASALEEYKNSSSHLFKQGLDHYQIEKVCKPIILEWVVAQHKRILEWTARTFDLEGWEPLSSQQRQAVSIIEVFRIIEETVDQLFGLNLPLDTTHLQALLSIIFHSLDVYLQKLLSHLVEKIHLYPLTPPLTRYKEDAVIPIVKKKLLEEMVLDDNVINKLNEMTASKICIRLNTLQYILKQIVTLENSIRKHWELVRPSGSQRHAKEEPLGPPERDSLTHSEAENELFLSTFDTIKDTATDATSRLCDIIGARVVFWDLRDTLLFGLYRGSVEGARLEGILPHVDTILNQICGLIDDTLRDRVVLSICRASMEAFVRIMIDGGPSRAFSDSDIVMVEDDLNVLKDFFVANGEGLPRSLVEQEAKLAEQILKLFSLQTEDVIQLLMTASEHISAGLDLHQHGRMCMADSHTLIRVLCHKKDREASKYLKMHYHLPISSEYDDMASDDSTLRSPFMADVLKQSSSFRWTKNDSALKSPFMSDILNGRSSSFRWNQDSYKSLKKKFQVAKSGVWNVAW